MKKVLFIKYGLQMDGVTSLFLNMSNYWEDVEVDYLIDEEKVPNSIKQVLLHTGYIYSIAKQFSKRKSSFYLIFKLIFIYQLLKRNKYDVVHLHTGEIDRSLMLCIVWLAGVPVRIIHSHSASSETNMSVYKGRLFKCLMKLFATHYMACSDIAARWMFPRSVVDNNNYIVVNNGVKVSEFEFNEDLRNSYRIEYQLENKVVYCTVGRLEKVKNYSFLLDVFANILIRQPNSVLLFVGQGHEFEVLNKKAKQYNMDGKVFFFGVRNDIPALLSMSDFFILPSLFEGLGMVLIEAQIAGLTCFASTGIPQDVAITNNIHFISLQKSAEEWAWCILNTKVGTRESGLKAAISKGYDIKSIVKSIEQFYTSAF